MPRYRLTIEYDGGPFTGWQSQAGGTSVQDLLERAVAIINGGPSMVYGAGRTDADPYGIRGTDRQRPGCNRKQHHADDDPDDRQHAGD